MLHYMYTGDYPDEPAEHVRILHPAQSAQLNSANGSKQHMQHTTPISEALVYHVRVNCIAGYYGVDDLAQVSANKVKELFSERWSADAFCKFIEVAGSTKDKHLRETIVLVAAANVSELVSKDIFSKGKLANDIAADVLKLSAQDHANQNVKDRQSKQPQRVPTIFEKLAGMVVGLLHIASS
ncbi:hypothetical protein F4860DRAFT_485669 [Xylaria cubensis]|nr:hypothetical protein F4860DRAFT_485669 [Xylaria cubensis]